MELLSPPVPWLMESSIPSIRYFTLARLVDAPPDDPSLQEARKAVMAEGVVPQILALQTESGSWAGEQSYYTPKYTSTHWAMLLLAELGADGDDERLRRGADFMLTAKLPWDNKHVLSPRIELECLYGNILHYSARCGFASDERAQDMAEYLSRSALEGGWRCPHNDGAPCAWGAARALFGFAALPESARSPRVQRAIEHGLDFLLGEDRLARADYPTGSGKPSAHWERLNFPLFYQADLLFVLRVVSLLGALEHPGAQSALDKLAAQMHGDASFHGASPFRQRTYRGIGAPEETHRWVTLQAHEVLRAAARVSKIGTSA